jgi:hypothetical protein
VEHLSLSKKEPLLSWALPILLGVTGFWLVVGPKILNPSVIGWLGIDNDPFQHYLGWLFFKQTPLTLPFGLNPLFGLDIASSIVYSDSIPLLAFFFKPFSHILPFHFQYFGIWTLACFLLQAFFGWKLIGLISNSTAIRVVSLPLFIFAPILLNRIGMHAALTGHFLLLAGLYLSLTNNYKNRIAKWIFLLSICALTHFYLLAIVLGIWIANLLNQTLKSNYSIIQFLKEFFLTIAVLALVMWQAGYFAVGLSSAGGGWGYGTWGVNLLSFFNAKSWSYILPPIYGVESHQDRFQYPGLGVFLVLLFALCKPNTLKNIIKNATIQQPYLIALLLIYVLFSISNHIGIGSFSTSFPLPAPLLAIGNALRASDRFFWPVVYLITLTGIAGIIRGYKLRSAILILFIASAIQVLDTQAGWKPLRQQLNSNVELNDAAALQNSFWESAANHYSQLILTPAQNSPDHWRTFGLFSAERHMGTTAAYLARIDVEKLKVLQKSIRDGQINSSALYILDEKSTPYMLSHLNFDHDLLTEIDGYRALAPGWKDCHGCAQSLKDLDPRGLFSPTFINKTIFFTKEAGIDKRFLLDGWSSFIENWGVWSDGEQSQLILPLPRKGIPKTLTLKLRAHVNANHPEQMIQLLINGSMGPQKVLHSFDDNTIVITIPPIASRQGYISLKMTYPNAKSPRQINNGSDIRVLAIGLKSATFQ